MDDDWKAAARELREEMRSVRDELRGSPSHGTAPSRVASWERRPAGGDGLRAFTAPLLFAVLGAAVTWTATTWPRSPLAASSLMDPSQVARAGVGQPTAADAAGQDNPGAASEEPPRRVAYRLVPHTVKRPVLREVRKPETYTVYRPVIDTVMKDEEYIVERPVTRRVMEDQRYTVRRPVRQIVMRPQTVTVQRPVTENVMVSQQVATPVLTPVLVNRFGFLTTEYQYVNSYSTQLVATPTTRMVPTQETRMVPVEEVRYVDEQRLRRVPVDKIEMVKRTAVRQTPTFVTRLEEEQKTRMVERQVLDYVDETEYRLMPAGVETPAGGVGDPAQRRTFQGERLEGEKPAIP